MRPPRLVLRDNSFVGCRALSMPAGRLHFDLVVNDILRDAELPPGDALLPLTAMRLPTRVSLDPRSVRLASMAATFDAPAPGAEGPGDPGALAAWDMGIAGEGSEGTRLLLVAFAQDLPVAHCHQRIVLLRDTAGVNLLFRTSCIRLQRDGDQPAHPIDLAVAAGVLAADLLTAVYVSVRAGTAISPVLRPEPDCEEGDLLVRQMAHALQQQRARLAQQGRRPSIVVHAPRVG